MLCCGDTASNAMLQNSRTAHHLSLPSLDLAAFSSNSPNRSLNCPPADNSLIFQTMLQQSFDSFYDKIVFKMSEMITQSANDLKQELGEKLKSEILTVKNDLQSLENRVLSIESQTCDSDLTGVNRELLFTELEKRRKARKNMIVYNFIHDDDVDDLVSFNKILHEFLPTLQPALSALRFGKSLDNKPLPLKVSFKSDQDVLAILSKKAVFAPLNIRIKNDQTPEQRSYLKSVQNELNARILKGEHDLTIRYINNVPTIVPKQKN